MRSAYILPTGDEIRSGVVLDCDSPEIMQTLIRRFPEIMVTRMTPLRDSEEAIVAKLEELLPAAPDLIVLVGGSGGGHRHSETLGMDFTQSALENYLDDKAVREIYGKNGHLWCKLVCGRKDGALIINLPGPFVEAAAAIKAFVDSYAADASLEVMNGAMAQAVYAQYPPQAATLP